VGRRANGKKHTLKINLKATRSETRGTEVFTETEEEEEDEQEQEQEQGYGGKGRGGEGNKSSLLN
jgi:hypothetical protein